MEQNEQIFTVSAEVFPADCHYNGPVTERTYKTKEEAIEAAKAFAHEMAKKDPDNTYCAIAWKGQYYEGANDETPDCLPFFSSSSSDERTTIKRKSYALFLNPKCDYYAR